MVVKDDLIPTIKPEVLVSAISEISLAQRVPADAARVVAEHLVDADLCGVLSHGIFPTDWCAQAENECDGILPCRISSRARSKRSSPLAGGGRRAAIATLHR
jgi:LDH2 family malate/lactate/ureidoglycolate dehydrogenase